MLRSLQTVSINGRPVAFTKALVEMSPHPVDIDVSLDQWYVLLNDSDCIKEELDTAMLRLDMADVSGARYSGVASWMPFDSSDSPTTVFCGHGPLDGWSE